jgi:hypothetical protein
LSAGDQYAVEIGQRFADAAALDAPEEHRIAAGQLDRRPIGLSRVALCDLVGTDGDRDLGSHAA